MFPGSLFCLCLSRKDDGVVRDRPIRSGVKGEIWVRGRFKEEGDDREYYDRGAL